MDNNLVKPKQKYILMSFIYAYIISISFLNALIGIAFDTGGMVINIAIVLGVAFLNIRQMVNIRVRIITIIYVTFIIAFYVVTTGVSFPIVSRNDFYFYFALTSLIGVYECDKERILRYAMYISLLAIPFHNDLLGGFMKDATVSMGSSFAMMPVFLSGVIHFFFFRRKGKVFDKICYIIDFSFLLEVVLKGNRGIALAVMITVFCLYIKNWGGKESRKITFRLVLVMAAVFFIYANFYQILGWVNDFLMSFDIEANFIQKTLRLQEKGDLSNGRDSIFNYTINEIMKSPFWGHGISTIWYNSYGRINYPHNFLLQLLYDGGLLLTIPVLSILFKTIKYAFKGKDREESAFVLYMLLICVPKMMFSSDMWRNAPFWLMLAHVLQFYSGKINAPKEGENHDDTVSANAECS